MQIDSDGRKLSLRYPMEVNLVGDSRLPLLPLLKPKTGRVWRDKIEAGVRQWWQVLEQRAMNEAKPINPRRAFWELSPRLPANAILTCDSGTSAAWYARDLQAQRGMMGSLSGGLATMCPAVPDATAASRGNACNQPRLAKRPSCTLVSAANTPTSALAGASGGRCGSRAAGTATEVKALSATTPRRSDSRQELSRAASSPPRRLPLPLLVAGQQRQEGELHAQLGTAAEHGVMGSGCRAGECPALRQSACVAARVPRALAAARGAMGRAVRSLRRYGRQGRACLGIRRWFAPGRRPRAAPHRWSPRPGRCRHR